MEKTYDELREELSTLEDSIRKKRDDLKNLIGKADQLQDVMRKTSKKEYGSLLGKYFWIKKESAVHTILLFVKSYDNLPDDTSRVKLNGSAFTLTRTTDNNFHLDFSEVFWIIVNPTYELEELSKEEIKEYIDKSYKKITEIIEIEIENRQQ